MPHQSQKLRHPVRMHLPAQASSERSLSDFAQTAHLRSRHAKMALVRFDCGLK